MAQPRSKKRRDKLAPGRKGKGRPSGRPRGAGSHRSSSRSRGGAKGLGGDQVEGRQAVRELLIAGSRKVIEVTVSEDLDQSDVVEDIVTLASELRIPLKVLPRRKVDSAAQTDSHQGVVAKAAPLKVHDPDKLAQSDKCFLFVLDGITDPRNLGAILRLAECAGVTGVVMSRHRAVHVTPAATKTAAGAIEYLPMALVGGIPSYISALKQAGVTTIGLDGSGESSIYDPAMDVSGRTALVLGAEGAGMARLTRERVDILASLPLAGQLSSLNVGTAAAAACYEIVRRRNLETATG